MFSLSELRKDDWSRDSLKVVARLPITMNDMQHSHLDDVGDLENDYQMTYSFES